MAIHFVSLMIAALSWGLLGITTNPSPNFGSIALEIENLETTQGEIHVAIYDQEEHFRKSLEPYRLQIHKTAGGSRLQLKLAEIPYGRYALAVYHDENGNGDLDKNLFGIPKEPYGFSNNPRAKWSAPTYEETSFILGPEQTSLTVSLKKWKDR